MIHIDDIKSVICILGLATTIMLRGFFVKSLPFYSKKNPPPPNCCVFHAYLCIFNCQNMNVMHTLLNKKLLFALNFVHQNVHACPCVWLNMFRKCNKYADGLITF
jgi:hypothetical protein